MGSPYTKHAVSGLPNPNHLEGEVRFVQAQDKRVVTARCPRIMTECLLTRSMWIKMYVLIFTADFVQELCDMFEYDFITTVTIEFDDSFQP